MSEYLRISDIRGLLNLIPSKGSYLVITPNFG